MAVRFCCVLAMALLLAPVSQQRSQLPARIDSPQSSDRLVDVRSGNGDGCHCSPNECDCSKHVKLDTKEVEGWVTIQLQYHSGQMSVRVRFVGFEDDPMESPASSQPHTCLCRPALATCTVATEGGSLR